VAKSGRQPFLFGSDFPHEVFDAAKCRHEIDELLAREDLTQETRKPCSAATLLNSIAQRFKGARTAKVALL